MDNRGRLMSKIVVNGECMEFSGGISSTGYGVFWMDGKNRNAHKASYILNVGGVPAGKMVLHKCDNKKCINPRHLYIGDAKDNAMDAIKRGKIASGSRHGSVTKPESIKIRTLKLRRFTDVECLHILELSSEYNVSSISLEYKAHYATIYRAIKRAKLLKQLES